jgi:hypothetical protein
MLSSNVLNQLHSTINNLSQPDSEIEFEVKFGFFNYYGNFKSQVDFKQFQRLSEKFNASSNPKKVVHITEALG